MMNNKWALKFCWWTPRYFSLSYTTCSYSCWCVFPACKNNCSPNRLQTNKQTWMLSSVVNDINNKFIAFNLVCWWTLRYLSLSYRCQEQFVFCRNLPFWNAYQLLPWINSHWIVNWGLWFFMNTQVICF